MAQPATRLVSNHQSHTLLVMDDTESVARDVAARWLVALARRNTSRPFTIALSGGRFPAVLYREFVRQMANGQSVIDGVRLTRGDEPGRGRMVSDLGNVHFFWADERCVPSDDPESNFGLAAKHLFTPLSVAEENIHRIPAERGETFAVAHAEAELCRVADLDDHGLPLLDLVFLGMGEDGHTASLFPGDKHLLPNPAVYRTITGPKPPPRRVTLGLPVLAVAREVWVVATGVTKVDALRATLTGGGTPLAHVLNSRTHTEIFTDFDLA